MSGASLNLDTKSTWVLLIVALKSGLESFIVISTLCVYRASPAACCWCRVSCCLFLMRKMFYLLKYNQSRITQDKQVDENQDQSTKGCSHKELDKENYQQ